MLQALLRVAGGRPGAGSNGAAIAVRETLAGLELRSEGNKGGVLLKGGLHFEVSHLIDVTSQMHFYRRTSAKLGDPL